MAACYAPDARFSDPVFDLAGDEVGAMWSMLCERGRDLRVEWRDVRADDATGAAHWEARYTFSATGRPVHNVIDAAFTFSAGRIARHVDTFDLWRWSRMALGAKGALLGWTPFVRNGDPAPGATRARCVDRKPLAGGSGAMRYRHKAAHGTRA